MSALYTVTLVVIFYGNRIFTTLADQRQETRSKNKRDKKKKLETSNIGGDATVAKTEQVQKGRRESETGRTNE